MTITKLLNQPVAGKRRRLKDIELIFLQAKNLSPIDGYMGDCIEVDVNPEDIRAMDWSIKFVIRQIEINKWRIWRQ